MPTSDERPEVGGEVVRGARQSISYLRLASGDEPARTFLESLKTDRIAQFRYRFTQLAEGYRLHKRHFKIVEGSEQIFEFKNDHNDRITCFFTSIRHVLLVEGFNRRGSRLPPQRIEVAEKHRRSFLAGLKEKADTN